MPRVYIFSMKVWGLRSFTSTCDGVKRDPNFDDTSERLAKDQIEVLERRGEEVD